MSADVLRIERLRARYRLRGIAGGGRERLDTILQATLDEALETALLASGVSPREEVCVRGLHVPVRLRWGTTDAGLVALLAGTVADAIRTSAEGDGVARYGSRAHALADLLIGVAGADLSRVWAWRQLGLWTGADGAIAASEAEGALRSNPRCIVPALALVAVADRLPALARALSPRAWESVAVAAVAAHTEGSPETGPTEIFRGDGLADPAREARHARSDAGVSSAGVAAILTRGRIGGVLLDVTAAPPKTLRALAILAILECEPAAWRAGASRGDRLSRALERELGHRGGANATVPTPENRERSARNAPGKPADALAVVASPPESSRASPDRIQRPAEAAAVLDRPIPITRAAGRTRWGGLLYLLNCLTEPEIAAAIEGFLEFSDRSLPWVLHRLALALVPIGEVDPAALAFAGLPPDRPPPSEGEAAATEAELDAIERLARSVGLRALERLGRMERSTPGGLRSVCRVEAEIVADPGWLEVRMPLEAISLDVRRAGLDRDPGWLSWLGSVVRFVYE